MILLVTAKKIMEAVQQVALYFCVLCVFAGHISCMLVYFHSYFPYDRAYDLCRRNNMRLVRVDSEDKLQTVAKFTEGLENFTMYTSPVKLSLRYDVTSSRHLWPDGTVNTIASWLTGQPKIPEAKQCVSQKKGTWRTRYCNNTDQFICETGYALDPTPEADTYEYYPVFKTFRRLSNQQVNPQDQVMTPFREGENLLNMYRGFFARLIEECAVWCTNEPVCAGITFTTNKDPEKNVCMILK